MDPAVYSRIKTPDAGVPLLQTESEVRAAHHLNNVMYMKEEKLSLQLWIAWLTKYCLRLEMQTPSFLYHL
jgi:hypothetical protein